MKFKPVIWPEEPVPRSFEDCRECGLYKQGTRMVWGEGYPDAPIMILLDNPGAREDREGNPFVCGTRQTLQEAAYEVGLRKDDLYVTYVLKRRPIRAYDKETVRHTCMVMHVMQQIQIKKPRMIFCLGNAAVQSFFDDPDAEVKNLRGKTHIIQGYPTFVAYHPLAIRRRPNLLKGFIQDWQSVADFYQSVLKGDD